MSVRATWLRRPRGGVFGAGDGVRTVWQLPGAAGPAPTLYQSGDWQGLRKLYPTPRTNLILRSTAIDPATYPAIWLLTGLGAAAPVVTYATADVLAPDGTQTASKIVYPVVNAAQKSAIGQMFTATVAGWSGALWLRTLTGTATIYLWFTNAGTGFPVSTSQTCNITTAWTRCSVLDHALTAEAILLRLGVDASAAGVASGQAANPGATIYAWGEQAEIGSASTPLIPTAGAAVTVTDYALGAGGLVTLAAPPPPGTVLSWKKAA